MDAYTLLDTYDPNLPSDKNAQQPITREAKDNAFYAASVVAKDTSEIPQKYQSILDDINRFGSSPVINEVSQNFKDKKQIEQKQFAEEILIDPTKNSQQKLNAIQTKITQDDASSTPKDAYLDSIDNKKRATIIVIGGDGQQSTAPVKPGWTRIPGKFIKNGSEESSSIVDNIKNFIDAGLYKGAEFVVANTHFVQGVAGTLIATKKASEAFKQQPISQSIGDLVELAGTTASGLLNTIAGGYAGTYQLFVTQDTAKANEAIQKMQEGIYIGDGALYNAGLEMMMSVGQIIDTPFQAIGELGFEGALKATDNIDFAAGTGATFYVAPMATAFVPMIQRAKYRKIANQEQAAAYYNRQEPSFEAPLGMSKDSPIGETASKDKGKAAGLAAEAMTEPTGVYADAMGTTKEDLITSTVLPKLDPNLKEIHPDAYQRLQELDADILRQLELNKVDPYLFDPAAIKNDMNKYMNVVESQNNLYIMRSSSYVEDSGSALRGHVVYGKSANNGFTDPEEIFANFQKLQQVIHRDTGTPYPNIKLKVIEDPDTGEKFLRWDFEKYYDPVQNTVLGTSALNARFAGWNISGFANTPVGKFIFSPQNRLIDWIVQSPGQAALRATNLTKDINKALRERILAIKPQKELADLIQLSEEQQTYFTPQVIQSKYPQLNKTDYMDLVEAYALFRRMDDHLYNITNTVLRNQKITTGLKGLYTTDGKYTKYLGKQVKPDENGQLFLYDEKVGHATEVYDFTPIRQLDPEVGAEVMTPRGAITINTKDVVPFDVYKLDRPVIINGRKYEYATGVQAGEVPRNLLPKVIGHYPHVNQEPYFIKAFPKELWVNGNKIEYTPENAQLFNDAATTVGVARTEKSAYQFAKDLQKDNPDYVYDIAEDKLTNGKDLEINYEHAKFAKDWGKARKRDRLELPDGTLGRLKDPVEALHDAYQQASKMYAFKDFDRIFRDRWVYSYGELTGGKFPESIADIKLDPNRMNPINRELLRAARNSYEQYSKQLGIADTLADKAWKSMNLWVAKQLEEVSPSLSESARTLSTKREPITSSLLKLAFVRSISFNPLKQYIVQTGQVTELMGLAALNGNMAFPIELAKYSPQLFVATVLKSTPFKKIIPDAERFIPKDPAFQRLLKAFEDTGIPSSINMHAVVDGVFLDAKSGLAETSFEQLSKKIIGGAKAIGGTPRAVGFDKAELANQIGMWLYAKTEFERLNPGKAFDDPHNLSMITGKALGIGNFMLSRADVLPYQEGMFRFLMQFQAFGNKAILQPFSSKSLTRDEKVKLAALRLAMYGKRGILGGEVIDQAITSAQDQLASTDPQDVQKKTTLDAVLETWRRGFYDLLANKALQAMFDDPDANAPKTEIAFTPGLSPSPQTTIPMGDLVVDLLSIMQQDQSVVNSFASMTGISSLADTLNVLYDGLYVSSKEPETTDEAMKYIRKLASWATGWSNFEKSMAMKEAASIVDKEGNSLEVGTTATEAFFQAIGIPSIKYEYYYEVVANNAALAKEVKSSATKIVKSLDFIVDTYGADKDLVNLNIQMEERIKSLITLYDKNGLGNQLRQEVHKQLKAQYSKGAGSVILKLLNQNASTYEGMRRSSMEKLNLLRETSGKETADMIDKMSKEMWGL